jgi:hypothetical protein
MTYYKAQKMNPLLLCCYQLSQRNWFDSGKCMTCKSSQYKMIKLPETILKLRRLSTSNLMGAFLRLRSG